MQINGFSIQPGLTAQSFLLLFLVLASLLTMNTISAQELTESFIRTELQRAQESPDTSVNFQIQAPSEFVFEFLLHRLDEYVDDAQASSFDHSHSEEANALGPGSERVVTMANNETLLQRFLQVEYGRSYSYFVDMNLSTVSVPLKYSISRYELLARQEEVTELKVTAVFKPSNRLLGYFVRRGFKQAFENDFEKAKVAIEVAYRNSTR